MNKYQSSAKHAVGRIEELVRVRLMRDVVADDGAPLAAGLKGTVVSVYGSGEAYRIEFTSPSQALATVGRSEFEAIEEEAVARFAPSATSLRR